MRIGFCSNVSVISNALRLELRCSAMNLRVDLNADLGEGAAHDSELFELITSANIACGFHAGDPVSVLCSIRDANEQNVSVGAHPSLLDRENFGRTEIAVEPAQ